MANNFLSGRDIGVFSTSFKVNINVGTVAASGRTESGGRVDPTAGKGTAADSKSASEEFSEQVENGEENSTTPVIPTTIEDKIKGEIKRQKQGSEFQALLKGKSDLEKLDGEIKDKFDTVIKTAKRLKAAGGEDADLKAELKASIESLNESIDDAGLDSNLQFDPDASADEVLGTEADSSRPGIDGFSLDEVDDALGGKLNTAQLAIDTASSKIESIASAKFSGISGPETGGGDGGEPQFGLGGINSGGALSNAIGGGNLGQLLAGRNAFSSQQLNQIDQLRNVSTQLKFKV
jgi:hypothetical protein